jgi:lipoprotein-releasing system permease protein
MYKAFLSLRYLRTRYIALASIVSVMLGVATMIVVNSVMKGFTSEMRSRIQGLLSDVVIETNSLDGAVNAREKFELVRSVAGDKIAGMTATVEVWGLITFPFAGQYTTRPITLIGIEPEGKASVGPFKQYLESYHAILDGKKQVRPPLRSPKAPAGWELTAEALAWRKEIKEREKWFKDHLENSHESPGEGDESRSGLVPAGHSDSKAAPRTPARTPVVAAVPNPSPSKLPPIAAEKHVGTPPTGPAFDDDPPFARNSPLMQPTASSLETPARPFDESAPMDARVIVGAGLLRYNFEDPKTGKTRTMEMVRPGEDVTISTVTSGRPPKPAYLTATVVDVFKCGMSEYDSNLVFCNLAELQKVRVMFDPQNPNDPDAKSITSIQIKLKNFADAPEVIERLQAVFPPGIFTIKTWEQKQGPLLAAVEIETGILNVLLFLIIAVAGFGILAIFFMIVVEKTRDIGVLKALGASSGGVMSIFLSYGLALGVVGSGVGVLLGLLFVRYINEIESVIASVTGRKVFDDKVYYFPEIPTLVETRMVVWVTIGAIAIAILASVFPARRAARLKPVEALRYE